MRSGLGTTGVARSAERRNDNSMTPEKARSYASILIARRRADVAKDGTFECESCQGKFPERHLGGVGVFSPDRPIETKAGSKKLFAAYAICDPCKEHSDKGFGNITSDAEQNLVRKGIFVDPTELTLSDDEREILQERSLEITQEMANKLGEWQVTLLSVIEDEDHQPYFQDGKNGSNLLEALTGLHDGITESIGASGKEPKGCCSEEDMTEAEREAQRTAWNTAEGIFRSHYPHVPVLVDDDPSMPKDSAKFRREVMAAIIDGIKVGREGR